MTADKNKDKEQKDKKDKEQQKMFKKLMPAVALAALSCGQVQDTVSPAIYRLPVEVNIATEQRVYETNDSVELTARGGSVKLPKIEHSLSLLTNPMEFNGVKPIPESVLRKKAASIKMNGNEKELLIIFYDKMPTELEKQKLEHDGIHIKGYYQNAMFFAKANAEGLEKIADDNSIGACEIMPYRKISDVLHAQINFEKNVESRKMMGIEISFSKSADIEDVNEVISKYNLDVREKIGKGKIIAAVNTKNAESIADILSQEESIQWITAVTPALEEIEPEPGFQTNADSRRNVKAEVAQDILNFDGSGVIAYVHDGGAVYEHKDLEGRVKVIDESLVADHATHVACTLAGSGARTEEWAEENGFDFKPFELRGVAPGIKRVVSDQHNHCKPYCLYDTPAEIDKECKIAIQKYNVDLSSNSIGTNIMRNLYPMEWFGDYETTCSIVDGMIRGSQGRKIVMMFAAGNENTFFEGGLYGTLGQPASAKNPIVVGAVDDEDMVAPFTSWGPTDDGRIGVTVVAPGVNIISCLPIYGETFDPIYGAMSGTSMATPAVSGVVALVLQAWRETTGIEEGRPLPSTIKAVLAHTATDVAAPGPDFKTGFGRVNAAEATEKIMQKQFVEGVLSETGDRHIYTLNIPYGKKRIKATLAWDDVPGVPGADKELVNDLDLMLISPEGDIYLPYILDPKHPEQEAVTGKDRLNNIEQVVVENPEPGKWKAVITGHSVPEGPQDYSLVYDEATNLWGDSYITNNSNLDAEVNVSLAVEKLEDNGWNEISTISKTKIYIESGERIELRDIAVSTGYVPREEGVYRIKVYADSFGGSSSDSWEFYVK